MSDFSGGNDKVNVAAIMHPFKMERVDLTVDPGHTIAEILEIAQADPMLCRDAHIFVGANYVPREHWHRVRPRAGAMVSVRAFVPPTGGGSQGKDILRSVLFIAIAAAAIAFGPALGAAIGLSGALAAGVGQAIIGVGGMLLVNALVPPRTSTAATPTPTTGVSDGATKFIEGARNNADPFGVVPVVFGKRKIVAKLGAAPITELVGDDQYLRMLFIWGVGPLDLTDFRIGETLLSEFEDVDVEHRYGYPGDTPFTLYPRVADQDNFQIALLQVDGFTTRTTSDNADEIGIDILFPEGLVTILDDGTRQVKQVQITVQYSVAGAGVWNSIPIARGKRTFPIGWTNSNGTNFSTINFVHKKTSAVRHGVSWQVPVRGTFDIRVRRDSINIGSDNIRDDIVWTTVRRFTNESPINSPVPIASTALRIKATDQLSGVIDEFSAVATMVAKRWNGGAWVEQANREPSSAFRHALQGNALQVPYPDSSIDLVKLAYWRAYCVTMGFQFDQVRDFSSSLYDLLADIAAAGRATVDNIDGKWTVIIDEPKFAVSHITPRNSSNFKASKAFVDYPHAFRVQFNNENEDYRNDELRVYFDGYSAANATKFETIEFPGVTDPVAIARHGRFMKALGVLRPEQWTFNQDMERLVYRRGDVVFTTHDVLLVGLASGRIKALQLDGGGNCTGVTVDERLTMDVFHFYGMTIRNVNNLGINAQIVAANGDFYTVVFVTPIPAANAPIIGDLFGFGEYGQETDKALVIDIQPSSAPGFPATVISVPYRDEIYGVDHDGGPIPAFETFLTPLDPVPDVQVVATRSNETVLTVGPGESLSVHVAVKVQPVKAKGAFIEAQIRATATEEPFADAKIDQVVGNEVYIGDVRSLESVDIRLRWIVPGRMPGLWSYVNNHLVIGKSTPPNPLVNLTVSAFGGQAYLRWDKPVELDVLFGGEVRFRHSEDPVPVWSNSVSIGEAAQARTLIAHLPLKPGTYLARVFDSSGNQSTVVTVYSKQASVLTYVSSTAINEAPLFSGAKTNLVVSSVGGVTSLFMDDAGLWDTIADVDLMTDNVDALGGTVPSGEYTFAFILNNGSIKKKRLTTVLKSFNVAIFDLIDSWAIPLDDRPDFDGTDTAQCDCVVYCSQTDTDPSGAPVWGAWHRLDSMEVEAWGVRFKAVFTSLNSDFNIVVTSLGITYEGIT